MDVETAHERIPICRAYRCTTHCTRNRRTSNPGSSILFFPWGHSAACTIIFCTNVRVSFLVPMSHSSKRLSVVLYVGARISRGILEADKPCQIPGCIPVSSHLPRMFLG